MKEFKGCFIPPVKAHDIQVLQEAHCAYVTRDCKMDDCDHCLFGSDNLEQFQEWCYDNGLAKKESIENH